MVEANLAEGRFRFVFAVAAGVRFLSAKDSPGVSGADMGDPGVQWAFFDVCQWVRAEFDSPSSIALSEPGPLPGLGNQEGGPGR